MAQKAAGSLTCGLLKTRRKAALLAFCLAGIGCLASTTSGAIELRVGDSAPSFVLSGLDSSKVTLQERLLDHPVMVSFISMPCYPCEESIPAIDMISSLHEANGQIDIICVAEGREDVVSKYLRSERYKTGAQIVVDGLSQDRGTVADQYGVMGTPAFFLVGRDGNVLWKHIGLLSWAKAGAEIERLIRGETGAVAEKSNAPKAEGSERALR